jgi:hypothetical protein
VSGRVLDAADREPLAGVSVVLEARSPALPGRLPLHSTTTDVEGRFTLRNVADGEWRLTAGRKGYATATREVPVASERGRDDLEIAMDPTEGLSFTTRLPTGGVPDEVRVAVLDAAGGTLVAGSFATGENGRVRLSTVPSGTWRVVVSAPGTGTTTARVQAAGAPMTIDLPPACALRVRVPELAGSGAIGILRLAREDGEPFTMLDWAGRPRAEFRIGDGVAEVATLPPGSWSVSVATADGRTWKGSSSTLPGAPAEVVLE